MRKKRFIMQGTSNTTYTAPALLVGMYEEQLHKFGFRDRSEALIYLSVGIWNSRNGVKNSMPVNYILNNVSVDRSPVFRLLPRMYNGICLSDADKDKIVTLTDFGYLTNIMNAVMEAFLVTPDRYKVMLRREMHARFVREAPASYWIQTYIKDSQYDCLLEMAVRGGFSFTSFIRKGIETILTAEGAIAEEWLVPFELQDAIQDYLHIEGFTFHHFSREVQFRMNIGSEECYNGIRQLVLRYKIPGFNEFLRRVMLFLLNSKNIQYQYNNEEPENEEPDYFDDNELYVNNRLSRKDFVRNIYQ